MSEKTQEKYKLDRKAASKLLKVSIRTLDRYIKSKKVSTRNINGRIWLDKKELQNYKDRQSGQVRVGKNNLPTQGVSTDKETTEDDKIIVYEKNERQKISARKEKRDDTLVVYQKLYQGLKEELKEKQERLEIANYRVGQLETQLKNTMPLIQYHNETFTYKQNEEELKENLKKHQNTLNQVGRKLKAESTNKKIFLLFLLIILALQPLWIVFAYLN